jgi:xylulokinase
MKYLIGIDLGTTLAKCVIYDEGLNPIAEAEEEMSINFPKPGWAEQDANDFYSISCALIKETLKKSRISKKDIKGISIDSQMGGIMAIDRNYNPVTYYDTPLDGRSAEENKYMHKSFGDLIIEKNGSLSTFGNKILYWKKRNEWKEIYKFIQPSSFVAGKLAGLNGDEAYIDDTFICFSGFSDLKKSEWSDELIDKMGIDSDKLPMIIKSTKVIGEVTKKASEDTGIPSGIPISAGCGDQSAGFVGAGILKHGQLVDVSGTACIFGACISDYRYDLQNKTLACMKSAIGSNYHFVSILLTGRTHKWFIDEFFAEDKENAKNKKEDIYSILDRRATNIEPGSGGLVSIDYLQGRFFPPDPNVRGLFIGHTWAHKKIHFYRAILESIAYDHYLTKGIIKELLPEIVFEKVTAIGSGAKSKLWMQIKADILQVPYQNLFRSDLSTLGSAIIAGFSTGLFKSMEDILERFIKSNVKITPNPGADKNYIKYIEIYKELFGTLKEIYRKISS